MRSVCPVALRSQVVLSGRVRLSDLSATDGLQLSGPISGMCTAPAPNCVLLVDINNSGSEGRVLRVSLAEKRVEQCLIRVPHTDSIVTDVQLLSGGTHIALALFRKGKANGYSHIVRLFAESQLNAWRVAHEFCFDTTSNYINPRLCVSRNLLLCAAPVLSRRLVALEVTHDSKLVQTGAVQFDSDMCAFTAGNDQLVATAHADRTVRLWHHVEAAAAARSTFALEECSRVSADTTFGLIISSAEGLLLHPKSYFDKSMRLCRTDGTRLDVLQPQPQLGQLRIKCGCAVGLNVLAYDEDSKSLVTFETRGSDAEH